MIRALGLFSGTGSFSLALRDMVRPVLYCDSDSFVQQHLKKLISNGHLPQAPILSDVKDVHGVLQKYQI